MDVYCARSIGIDLMGSDCLPMELFRAAYRISYEVSPVTRFTIFLDQPTYKLIEAYYTSYSNTSNISFQICEEVISMTDDPFTALKKKKSSLALGIKALGEGKLQAFVTAGNTSALYLSAKKYLPLKASISRPFLMASLSFKGRRTMVLCDAGANMSCKASHLLEFAEEAATFYRQIYANITPTVALLNVGVEAFKGTQELRIAYRKLTQLSANSQKACGFKFIGNIEGRNIFREEADIIVTDGFSGNILLKTMEGTAAYVCDRILTLMENAPERERLKRIFPQFHYAEFSGAILAGVEGLIIKCHGDASETSMYNSIKGALQTIQQTFQAK